MFAELFEIKKDIIDESAFNRINKFDILDFAPEEKEIIGVSKKTKTIVIKSSGNNSPNSSEDSLSRQLRLRKEIEERIQNQKDAEDFHKA